MGFSDGDAYNWLYGYGAPEKAIESLTFRWQAEAKTKVLKMSYLARNPLKHQHLSKTEKEECKGDWDDLWSWEEETWRVILKNQGRVEY